MSELALASCGVCGVAVRSAHEGVQFRRGQQTLTLCTKHLRVAQVGVAAVGRAAVQGLARALEVPPEQLRVAGEIAARVFAALSPPRLEESVEPIEASPSRPRTVTVSVERPRSSSKRRARVPVDDVIDAEYEVVR